MKYAACRGKDPTLWIGDDTTGPDPVAAKYCAACVVRAKCIDLATGYTNEQAIGLWGGTRENMRKELRRRQARHGCDTYRAGCSCHYCVKVTEILNPGRSPISSNSRGARHGYTSTHGKGCRCRGCCHAAAWRTRKNKQHKPDDTPVVIVLDDERCEPHQIDRCRACAHVEAMTA